jgi:hypothetical protein
MIAAWLRLENLEEQQSLPEKVQQLIHRDT